MIILRHKKTGQKYQITPEEAQHSTVKIRTLREIIQHQWPPRTNLYSENQMKIKVSESIQDFEVIL